MYFPQIITVLRIYFNVIILCHHVHSICLLCLNYGLISLTYRIMTNIPNIPQFKVLDMEVSWVLYHIFNIRNNCKLTEPRKFSGLFCRKCVNSRCLYLGLNQLYQHWFWLFCFRILNYHHTAAWDMGWDEQQNSVDMNREM